MRHTDLSIKLLSKLKLADTDTLIVDDTPEVWSEHRRNLLQIDRYTFFPLRADELFFFLRRRMRTVRGTIWRLFIRLCKVGDEHHNSAKMDCRDTLARLRRKILRGYRIYVDRDVHGIRQMAAEMGACLSKDTTRITHHVTKNVASSKTYTLVSPKWILYCYMFLYNVPTI
jgi:hypothetical protein